MKRAFPVLFILSLMTVKAASIGEQPSTTEVFRIGVSRASFGTVNSNDATAALKAWAASVRSERKMQLDVQINVHETVADLHKALAQGTIQSATMTTEEFLQSGEQPAFVYLAVTDTDIDEHYVVLVRRNGGVEDMPDLRGRRLVRHLSPKMSAALPWLETAFAERNLGSVEEFLGELTTLDSPTKSILQVFFRQSDACLVTANAFELACELNPQLRQQLRVLATSPPLIAGVYFIRDDYASPQRSELEVALREVHKTTAGRQALMLFQSSRVEKHPVSCLDGTRQMFKRYFSLTGKTNTTPRD